MRGRVILALLGAMLVASTASPAAAARGGICIPSGDPHHRPPLCIT